MNHNRQFKCRGGWWVSEETQLKRVELTTGQKRDWGRWGNGKTKTQMGQNLIYRSWQFHHLKIILLWGGRVWNLFKKVKCKKCQIEKRKWRKINTVVSLSAPYIRRLFCCSHTWLMREVQRVQLAFLCHNPHTFPNVRKWMVYHLGHYYTHTHRHLSVYPHPGAQFLSSTSNYQR